MSEPTPIYVCEGKGEPVELRCPGCDEFIAFTLNGNGKIKLLMYPLLFYYVGGNCCICGREIKWSQREGVNEVTIDDLTNR